MADALVVVVVVLALLLLLTVEVRPAVLENDDIEHFIVARIVHINVNVLIKCRRRWHPLE
jgi:hypothetical protein